VILVPTPAGPLRIGEFARRVGVLPERLRAWERRYGLLRPLRSTGGFRLYTDEDARRVTRMRRALEQGLSAAEAAQAALQRERPAEPVLEGIAERLLGAIRGYDESAAEATLDELFGAFALESVLRDALLPCLRQVGCEWEDGTLAVSHEHFASNIIRGRLLSLARLWGRGGGPLALLACVPGEAHDISLLAFGLVMRTLGWRVLFLGADTPIAAVAKAAAAARPAVVVLSCFDSALLRGTGATLRDLGRAAPVFLAGPGVSPRVCARLGVGVLDGDLVRAASDVAHGGTTTGG
jgi:MerR family transcriptional regulator, light-induced transcriptional regulator